MKDKYLIENSKFANWWISDKLFIYYRLHYLLVF